MGALSNNSGTIQDDRRYHQRGRGLGVGWRPNEGSENNGAGKRDKGDVVHVTSCSGQETRGMVTKRTGVGFAAVEDVFFGPVGSRRHDPTLKFHPKAPLRPEKLSEGSARACQWGPSPLPLPEPPRWRCHDLRNMNARPGLDQSVSGAVEHATRWIQGNAAASTYFPCFMLATPVYVSQGRFKPKGPHIVQF
ncbi:hypothetical protein N658DRAFT_38587 [Parathielavia hyrcaniae]|uniref:Uncharacterized protein n=1 Tax=Parathielavia hyrcaniae TaxID=113614 RepID=A0AAN6Q3Y5_9PEZI|nr:hypothetical protein N658DRAFT_38587 [Parathielavia hyrcaniae]